MCEKLCFLVFFHVLYENGPVQCLFAFRFRLEILKPWRDPVQSETGDIAGVMIFDIKLIFRLS